MKSKMMRNLANICLLLVMALMISVMPKTMLRADASQQNEQRENTTDIPAPEAIGGLVYKGTPQNLINGPKSIPDGYDMAYCIPQTTDSGIKMDWTTNAEDIKGTDAGTYEVYYKLVKKENPGEVADQGMKVESAEEDYLKILVTIDKQKLEKDAFNYIPVVTAAKGTKLNYSISLKDEYNKGNEISYTLDGSKTTISSVKLTDGGNKTTKIKINEATKNYRGEISIPWTLITYEKNIPLNMGKSINVTNYVKGGTITLVTAPYASGRARLTISGKTVKVNKGFTFANTEKYTATLAVKVGDVTVKPIVNIKLPTIKITPKASRRNGKAAFDVFFTYNKTSLLGASKIFVQVNKKDACFPLATITTINKTLKSSVKGNQSTSKSGFWVWKSKVKKRTAIFYANIYYGSNIYKMKLTQKLY